VKDESTRDEELGRMMVFHTRGYVATDYETLQELLRLIRESRKTKAVALVRGIIRRQRESNERQHRELDMLAASRRKAKRQAQRSRR
jgi:hypothetical protein